LAIISARVSWLTELFVWQTPLLQVWLEPQVPQPPPQPSAPQALSEQFGTQTAAQTPLEQTWLVAEQSVAFVHSLLEKQALLAQPFFAICRRIQVPEH
jgi:hypothetical protein